MSFNNRFDFRTRYDLFMKSSTYKAYFKHATGPNLLNTRHDIAAWCHSDIEAGNGLHKNQQGH